MLNARRRLCQASQRGTTPLGSAARAAERRKWSSALPSTTAPTETGRRKRRRSSCTTCHGTSRHRRSRCFLGDTVPKHTVDVHDSALVRFLLQPSLVQHTPAPQDDVDMLMDFAPQFAAKPHRVLDQVSSVAAPSRVSCAVVECGRFCSCPGEFLCAAPCTWVCIVDCLAVFSGLFFCVSLCSCATAGEQSNH